MTRRIFPCDLCCKSRTSPVPLSFHSFASLSNLNNFALLSQPRVGSETMTIPGCHTHSHLKQNIFIFFVCLCLYLLLQFYDWLKLRIILGFILAVIALSHTVKLISYRPSASIDALTVPVRGSFVSASAIAIEVDAVVFCDV